jgi:hypothetical protein
MVIWTWQLSAISCVRELSAILDSLVLWRFHARNAACGFTSRSLTQRPIDLIGEIVRYSTARVSKRLTDKSAAQQSRAAPNQSDVF